MNQIFNRENFKKAVIYGETRAHIIENAYMQKKNYVIYDITSLKV